MLEKANTLLPHLSITPSSLSPSYGYTLEKEQNKMIPACFSQPNTPSSSKNSFSEAPQNVVTCIYQTQLFNTPTFLTLSWSRTLYSHSLTIYATDLFSTTISLNPSTFSFFKAPHGSKSIYHQHFHKIKLYWNFTRAEFIQNSAEPDSCFYLAIAYNGKLQFFLGDLLPDLTRRQTRLEATTTSTTNKVSDPILLSRREHVFGSKKSYVSRAVFMGCKHEIEIECNGGALRVKVDGQVRLVVKRLAWKFRGNEKIFINGVEVEFYWDVLSWVANSNNDNYNKGNSNGNNGHGVFVFQAGGDGTVWPEMVGAEKKLMRKGLLSGSGVLQWAEESSDGGRSSSSSSTRSSGSNGGGFSLLLYAWSKY